MSRFPGAEFLIGCALTLVLTSPILAAETGAEAFEQKDYGAAETLWRQEAASGSAEAMLGLGLLFDLGLGVARDAAVSMRWYLEAADLGLAEAQFNVGVMLDSGAGGIRLPEAAAIWYSRAAASGHARSRYNLGLLYEAGDGVPKNPDLASYWFAAANDLSAAREKMDSLDLVGVVRTMAAPVPLGGTLRRDGKAELVWAASPGPVDARFVLQLAYYGESSAEFKTIETEASAITIVLPENARLSWRVTRVDRAAQSYSASQWQSLQPTTSTPKGRMRIRTAPGDLSAQSLASELSAVFGKAGFVVEFSAPPESDVTSVRYGFGEDAPAAAAVASFLPVLRREDAQMVADGKMEPGDIMIDLRGGPAISE